MSENENVQNVTDEAGSENQNQEKRDNKLKIIIPVIVLLLLLVLFIGLKFKGDGYSNKYVPGNSNNNVNPNITYVDSHNNEQNDGQNNITDDAPDDDNSENGTTPTAGETVTPSGSEITITGGTSTEKTPTPTVTPKAENPKPTNTPVPTPQNTGNGGGTAQSGTPVSNHGALSVKGTQLVDKNGNAFQLKGASTHGLQWFPQYVNKAAFQSLRDEWGCNVVRLALYTHENGYCSGGNKETLKKLVTDGVSYATDLGMYVIIDWHILQEQNPHTYKSEAIAFFDEMSEKYASYNNVIYEICNEPNGNVSWSDVKSYATEVIATIRANDKDAIIIVGTPTWSQDVDKAAADPITGYSNIMYALHFYADTHTDWLRTRMVNAINAGLPIFVSEFGICDASGNGACNISQANSWVETMDKYGVSYICWNLANKNESSSMIANGNTKTSGWTYEELSTEGKWLVDTLGGSIAKYTSGAKKSTTGGSSSVDTPKPTNTPVPTQSAGTSSPTKAPTTAPTKAPTQAATSGNVSVTTEMSNSWQSGSGKCYQYNLDIKNNSSSEISNWTVTITFSGDVSIDQSWNAEYTVSGNTVTVKPVEDWAKTLAAGGSFNGGFIISGPDGLSQSNIKITY